jgi:excisionase family DNA binding protein
MTTPPIILNMTVPEAARALGCSRDHIYSLINAKRLPFVQLGGTRSMMRIRIVDLVAFNDAVTFGAK